MAGRFGPQSVYVEAFISAMWDLTCDEGDCLIDAWGSSWGPSWDAAWAAIRYAPGDDARYSARCSAQDVVHECSWVASRGVEWDAALYAVQALVVVDLVGWRGLTWGHIDVLVGPCRVVPRLAAVIDAAIADVSGSS